MQLCPSRERLGEYLGHQLTGLHRTTVMAHVEECSACQAILEELTRGPAFENWRLLNASPGHEASPGADFLRRLKEIPFEDKER
jgi:hypothetical protein